MTNTIKTLTLIAFLSALAACGGSDGTPDTSESEEIADETGLESEDVIVDTASDVVTTLADVNGFHISTTTLNPHSYDYSGTEVSITAFVKDHSNNNVADGTVVTFVTDDNGMIENQCATLDGVCSVTWTSTRDRSQPGNPSPDSPDAGYVNDYLITIMARTIGEDSFIDKNSNSVFDINVDGTTDETYFTQSEAFLDANDNYAYDAGVNDFDEYFEYNGDGAFTDSSGFTKFRGQSCSAAASAAGHCAEQLEVWDSIALINSHGGEVTITLYPSVDVNGDCTGVAYAQNAVLDLTVKTDYCLELQDTYGNMPPIGTKIKYDADNGSSKKEPPSAVPNIYNSIGKGYMQPLTIIPDGTTSTDTLSIEIESVQGSKTYATYYLDD